MSPLYFRPNCILRIISKWVLIKRSKEISQQLEFFNNNFFTLTLIFGNLFIKGLFVENGQFLNELKKIFNQLPSLDFFFILN